MEFDPKTVRNTINKAFLKEPVERTSFNDFKDSLGQLLDQIDSARSKNEHEVQRDPESIPSKLQSQHVVGRVLT